jgi:hypothetical protein
MEISMEVPQKCKNRLTLVSIISVLDIYPRRVTFKRDAYITMFIAFGSQLPNYRIS